MWLKWPTCWLEVIPGICKQCQEKLSIHVTSAPFEAFDRKYTYIHWTNFTKRLESLFGCVAKFGPHENDPFPVRKGPSLSLWLLLRNLFLRRHTQDSQASVAWAPRAWYPQVCPIRLPMFADVWCGGFHKVLYTTKRSMIIHITHTCVHENYILYTYTHIYHVHISIYIYTYLQEMMSWKSIQPIHMSQGIYPCSTVWVPHFTIRVANSTPTVAVGASRVDRLTPKNDPWLPELYWFFVAMIF